METDLPTSRPARLVSWWTVGVFAVVLAAADGFWATSLRGAVGYIEDTQEPFRDWLLYLAVMIPIMAGAVLLALWLADRLARDAGRGRRLLIAAGLVVALTTVVAVAQVALTATYDYRSQLSQLTVMHHARTPNGTVIRLDPGVTPVGEASDCTGLCSAKQQTYAVHVRAVKLAIVLLLLTNAVLVLWALALRGGQVWVRRRGSSTEPAGAV